MPLLGTFSLPLHQFVIGTTGTVVWRVGQNGRGVTGPLRREFFRRNRTQSPLYTLHMRNRRKEVKGSLQPHVIGQFSGEVFCIGSDQCFPGCPERESPVLIAAVRVWLD